ncbi:MAG TPA: cytochrome c biogenesis protein CcdA [Epulopiscium sp.]|nr:cytochrome c biogenesis protein CcdA [Candidatus Epulonipiscium sp.]
MGINLGTNFTYSVVFLEGLASFISPCVLALIPTYISYLAGTSIDEIENSNHNKRTLMINALGFVFGLFIVFSLLGATATTLGRTLNMNRAVLQQVSGIIIIIFGIFYMGIINFNFMNREKRIHIKKVVPTLGGSIIFGMSFAFGWTPCMGPALGSVLMMAANAATLWNGILLLSIYTLGLGIPLLLIALFIERLMPSIQKIYKHFGTIKIVSGILLIIIGLLIFFNKLNFLIV